MPTCSFSIRHHRRWASAIALALILAAVPVSAQTVSTLELSAAHTIDGLLVTRDGRLLAAGAWNSDEVISIAADGTVRVVASGLRGPIHLAEGPSGVIYVSNFNDGTVSQIQPSGEVSTFASGFDGPSGLAVDAAGNLYVANWGARGAGGTQIHKVSPEGETSVFASDHGLDTPIGLAFDAAGNLLVANGRDGKVHRISPAGEVELFATVPQADKGWSCGHMVFVGERLFLSGNHRHVIYEIDAAGGVEVFAGTGQSGRADGRATAASFVIPNGLAADATHQRLWVALGGNTVDDAVRRIDLSAVGDRQ
jgi:sugar lactone lactonase YvrE